jgi:tRNA A-37 threonylcarbamoyl transferase component Bud32
VASAAFSLMGEGWCLRAQVMIDFGLGGLQPVVEDKAVDLYVLDRAFASTHPHSQPLVSHRRRNSHRRGYLGR